jgi:hypothetical protein
MITYSFIMNGKIQHKKAAIICELDNHYIIVYGTSVNTGKSEVFTRTQFHDFGSLSKICMSNLENSNNMKTLCRDMNVRVSFRHSSVLSDKTETMKMMNLKYFIFGLHALTVFEVRDGINVLPDEFKQEMENRKIVSEEEGNVATKIKRTNSFNSWDLRLIEFEFVVNRYVYESCKYDAFVKPHALILLDFGQFSSEYGYNLATLQIMDRCEWSLYNTLIRQYKSGHDHDRASFITELVYVFAVLHRDAKIIHNDPHVRNIMLVKRERDQEHEDFGIKFTFTSNKPILIDFDLCKFKYGLYIRGIKIVSMALPEDKIPMPQVTEITQAEADLTFARFALSDILGVLSNFKQVGNFSRDLSPETVDTLDKYISLCNDYAELISQPGVEYVLPGEYILVQAQKR